MARDAARRSRSRATAALPLLLLLLLALLLAAPTCVAMGQHPELQGATAAAAATTHAAAADPLGQHTPSTAELARHLQTTTFTPPSCGQVVPVSVDPPTCPSTAQLPISILSAGASEVFSVTQYFKNSNTLSWFSVYSGGSACPSYTTTSYGTNTGPITSTCSGAYLNVTVLIRECSLGCPSSFWGSGTGSGAVHLARRAVRAVQLVQLARQLLASL